MGVCLFGFVSVIINLGQQQINIEGGVFVDKVVFEFFDLFFKYSWGVVYVIDDIEIVSIGDCSSQFGISSDVYVSKKDRVFDVEYVGDGSMNLFCLCMLLLVGIVGDVRIEWVVLVLD